MGTLKNCLSVVGDSVEVAVFELYDHAEAINVSPTNPGFDDVLGEPYLEDGGSDGIGERVRPGTVVSLKCKADFGKHEEQSQDGAGNAPSSFLTLTLFKANLEAQVPALIVAGKILVRPNDRLLRIEDRSVNVRVDFEADGRDGLHVFRVDPGETGTGIVKVFLEKRRPAAQ